MVAEDYYSRAFAHFSIVSQLQSEIEAQKQGLARVLMENEDFRGVLWRVVLAAKASDLRVGELLVTVGSLEESVHSKEEEILQKSLENQRINAFAQSLRSKIPDEYMDQPRPIENLLRQIRDLEATIDASNQIRLSHSDKEIMVEIQPEKGEMESQTDIGQSFFDNIRPKSRSSGPGSKPGTPLNRPIVKGQIVLDDSTLAIMETARKGVSSRSRGIRSSPKSDVARTSRAFEMVGSKQGKREVEDNTPFVMKSVYKHDSSPTAAGNKSVSGVSGASAISGEDTSPIARSTNSGSIRKLPSIHFSKGPPPEIKSYIRAAVSRRKDDFAD